MKVERPLIGELGAPRAIESDDFPFEDLSDIAERESWRKEVYRPIYHLQKWWAQRLGSVFRATILGAALPAGHRVLDEFYRNVSLDGLVVFDPFMGSGTTVGEAAKLGCTALGRDINPVACRAIRVSLGSLERRAALDALALVERTAGDEIRALYRSIDGAGRPCEVLYFFWVKVLDCPACRSRVDLFSDYFFARHALASKNPAARLVCPNCGGLFPGLLTDSQAHCPHCQHLFDPRSGPARKTTAVCPSCSHEFPMARTARAAGRPPDHRLYAKLVLRADGKKEYLPATEADRAAFEDARRRLVAEHLDLPDEPLQPGHNVDQVLGYGYRTWCDFFNDRQLLALGLLARAIRAIPDEAARAALAVVFSGTLEFNNLFASYKGEGTGAVRHMFSHHILKPERTPLEANVWGTPRSSGSFSTLFRSRLLRALEYRDHPFEVAPNGSRAGNRVHDTSASLAGSLSESWPPRGRHPGRAFVSCGSSVDTGLADRSVDVVATDPPFFDNVHYSELADLFHVWQRRVFDDGGGPTTRHLEEVQDSDAQAFGRKLGAVFAECRRVLRDEGILVFSYHHSREDGWLSVAHALAQAGLNVVQAHPVKSEMSVAAPKTQAKEPIDLDVLIVCRKHERDARPRLSREEAASRAEQVARSKVRRLQAAGRSLSKNDARVVLMSSLLAELAPGRTTEELTSDLAALGPAIPSLCAELSVEPAGKAQKAEVAAISVGQLGLPLG